MKDLQTALTWANAYIEDFRNKYEYDPLAMLEGTADRKQKIFALCCDLLFKVETLNEQFTEELKKLS